MDNQVTINPYLTGGRLLLSRLIWDLHPYAWISRRRLYKWKNRFAGQRAIILCNGPSLNAVDFNLIQNFNVFTFGLNKINLLFRRTDFRPSAVVAVNRHVIDQSLEFFNQTDLPLFVDYQGVKKVGLRRNIVFLYSATSPGKFARDCSIAVNQGYTVTFVAMQLAYHMGFKQVGLVGCDHSFAAKGPANKAVKSGGADTDHFDPNYFANGNVWELPDLTMSELHYQVAKETYENGGRKIINCTEGGKLEIFERQHLKDFLQRSE